MIEEEKLTSQQRGKENENRSLVSRSRGFVKSGELVLWNPLCLNSSEISRPIAYSMIIVVDMRTMK